MRSLIVLALVASVASAQEAKLDSAAVARLDATVAPFQLRVRAADTTRVASMDIAWTKQLFWSIGAVRGTYGEVFVGPSGGSGRGTIVASVRMLPGRMTFTAPADGPELELALTRPSDPSKPALIARGRLVAISVASDGEFSVASRP